MQSKFLVTFLAQRKCSCPRVVLRSLLTMALLPHASRLWPWPLCFPYPLLKHLWLEWFVDPLAPTYPCHLVLFWLSNMAYLRLNSTSSGFSGLFPLPELPRAPAGTGTPFYHGKCGNHYCCSPIIYELHSLSPWYVAGALWFIWRINKNEVGEDKHLIVWARPSWILFSCQGNSLCSGWPLHHHSCVPECWNGLTSLPTSDGHVMCAKKKKKKLSF